MRTGQPAPDQGILTLLKELFVHHGHMVSDGAQLEGKSGNVYEIPLLAESETGAVVVGAHEGPHALTEADVETFRATITDVAADRGILVHLGPATPAALDAARGLVLWDRTELGRLVGDACLAEALDETAAPMTFETPRRAERLAAEHMADILPPAFASRRQEPSEADAGAEPFTLPEIAASVSSMFEAPLEVAPAAVAVPLPSAEAFDPPEPMPDLDALAAELAAIEAPAEPEPPAEPTHSFSPWADMASAADATVPALDAAPPVAPLVAPLAPMSSTRAGPPAAVPLPPAPRPSAPALVFSPPAAAPAMAKAAMPALTASMASLVATATARTASPATVPDSPFGMLLASSAIAPPAQLATAAAPAAATPPATTAPMQSFDPWNAPASSAGAPMPAVAAMPAAPRTYSRQILPVRLRPEEAHRKVKDRLYSLKMVELILHPVHLFDYECDVLQDGKLTFDTADGRMQVHGADKSTQDLDPDVANPEATGVLPPNHPHTVVERVLRIPAERAVQLAQAHVVKKHSKTVDMRVPDLNSSLYYTERRKVEPTADQVRLTPLGIFFRPVWRLHGDNGFVDVDAMDGRELDAQLVGSRHGAMMLD